MGALILDAMWSPRSISLSVSLGPLSGAFCQRVSSPDIKFGAHAEQRPGSASIGSLRGPIDFTRDAAASHADGRAECRLPDAVGNLSGPETAPTKYG